MCKVPYRHVAGEPLPPLRLHRPATETVKPLKRGILACQTVWLATLSSSVRHAVLPGRAAATGSRITPMPARVFPASTRHCCDAPGFGAACLPSRRTTTPLPGSAACPCSRQMQLQLNRYLSHDRLPWVMRRGAIHNTMCSCKAPPRSWQRVPVNAQTCVGALRLLPHGRLRRLKRKHVCRATRILPHGRLRLLRRKHVFMQGASSLMAACAC